MHRIGLEVERKRRGARPAPSLFVAAATGQGQDEQQCGKDPACARRRTLCAMQDRGPAAYIAEFVGTLLLVFFITAVVSLYGPEPSPQNPNPFIDYSVIGLVHVLVLFVLIQTLAVISGAHFNPPSPRP
jgi:hypothetical protein